MSTAERTEAFVLPPGVTVSRSSLSATTFEPIFLAHSFLQRPAAEETISGLREADIQTPTELRAWLINAHIIRPIHKTKPLPVAQLSDTHLAEVFGEERVSAVRQSVDELYSFLGKEALIDGWTYLRPSETVEENQDSREAWRMGVETSMKERQRDIFKAAYTSHNQFKGVVMAGPVMYIQFLAKELEEKNSDLAAQIEEESNKFMDLYYGVDEAGNRKKYPDYYDMDVVDKLIVIRTLEGSIAKVLGLIAGPEIDAKILLVT